MPTETEEVTTEETTTTDTTETADTTTTTDATVEAGAGADEAEVEETPEAKLEREKKERADARIKAAESAERSAEEKRSKKRRELEEQDRAERITTREREAERMVARAKEMLDDIEQRKQKIAAGGLEGMKALGFDYGELTKQVLTANTPEAIAQQALDRAERLERKLAEVDERAGQRAAAEANEVARQRFVEFADANAEDFPHAAELSPRLFKTLADEAAAEYRREFGSYPSFGALLPRVDNKAKEEQEEGKKRSAKRVARPTSEPSDGTQPRESNGQSASTPTNRTLNGAAAATKATPKRPMTDEEIDEWALNELRQAMRSDSKKQPTR